MKKIIYVIACGCAMSIFNQPADISGIETTEKITEFVTYGSKDKKYYKK